MPIIQQCCCCGWNLRKGCYVSATFSLIYFFIFTFITGPVTVANIQQLLSTPKIYKEVNDSLTVNGSLSSRHHRHQHAMGRTSSVTLSSSYPRGNESLEGIIAKNASTPSELDMDSEAERDSVSFLRLFVFSDAFAVVETVNMIVDLICEVVGVYASILLIRALHQDRKGWFWPWMIVVPSHILIDAVSVALISMQYFIMPMDVHVSYMLFPMFMDLTLNSINAYGLICVISQYQEYKEGRGTAAYVEFNSQTPAIMLETASSAKTVLNKPIALSTHNRRKSAKDSASTRSYNDKSDSYCEEFSLQNLGHTIDSQVLADGRGARNGNSHKIKNGKVAIQDDGESRITPAVSNELESKPFSKETNSSSFEDSTGTEKLIIDTARKGSVTSKYGKYLSVQNRRPSLAKDVTTRDEYTCSIRIVSDINKENCLSKKNNKRHFRNEQFETEANRSDSDSEDPEGLSAFGIISSEKEA